MTSAFILPDVTMRNPGEATLKLSSAAQYAFDNLAKHDVQNCTICTRIMDQKTPGRHEDQDKKQKVKIPRPVPISERPLVSDNDATVRPSQSPALALATVMKCLEDELSHLKIQLAKYQSLYNQHDSALSKRKRKAIYTKIETLLREIDTKADQIYALYDVLEGQKDSINSMPEEALEITLQSIGIDPHSLNLRGGELSNDEDVDEVEDRQPEKKHPWDIVSDDGSHDSLPWEGFEPTDRITEKVFGGRRSSFGL
jgi:hypothetical protein